MIGSILRFLSLNNVSKDFGVVTLLVLAILWTVIFGSFDWSGINRSEFVISLIIPEADATLKLDVLDDFLFIFSLKTCPDRSYGYKKNIKIKILKLLT